MREVVRIDVIPSDRVSITFSEILSLSSKSFIMMSNNTIRMFFAGFIHPDIETFQSFTDLNWRRITTFLNHNLPDFGPTFVVCLGHSTLIKHIVTNSNKNLKLFLSCKSISLRTSADDFEHLAFVSNH